jgi:AcrR family transcriptional regulator
MKQEREMAKPEPATERRTRLHADVRRRLIIDAAFQTIATSGFEGLRTRDIADVVGINSATLHHHFPTKDDLVAGIAEELERRLRSEKTTAIGPNTDSAVVALQCQFADAAFYRDERPDLLIVYREFVARAPRDSLIDKLVTRLNAGWKSNVVGILQRGVKDGSLRPDLNVAATSEIVLNMIWGGLSRAPTNTENFRQACEELLRLLKPQPRRPRS